MKKRVMTVFAVLTTALMMAWVAPLFAGDTGKVNINTAPLEELITLEGVGETYAERIIAYREKNGDFKNPEEILNVKGIGEKTFAANKDRIVVQDN